MLYVPKPVGRSLRRPSASGYCGASHIAYGEVHQSWATVIIGYSIDLDAVQNSDSAEIEHFYVDPLKILGSDSLPASFQSILTGC